LITIIRLANSEPEFGGSWCADRLEVGPLITGSRDDDDSVLDKIVDFATEWICPVCGKIGRN
jgi:hypothetical protein